MKTYGIAPDDAVFLADLATAVGAREVDYTVHFPRVAVDALPCKLPLSLVTVVVLANKVCVRAFQAAPGKRTEITET